MRSPGNPRIRPAVAAFAAMALVAMVLVALLHAARMEQIADQSSQQAQQARKLLHLGMLAGDFRAGSHARKPQSTEAVTAESLVNQAIEKALTHAQIEPRDVTRREVSSGRAALPRAATTPPSLGTLDATYTLIRLEITTPTPTSALVFARHLLEQLHTCRVDEFSIHHTTRVSSSDPAVRLTLELRAYGSSMR